MLQHLVAVVLGKLFTGGSFPGGEVVQARVATLAELAGNDPDAPSKIAEGVHMWDAETVSVALKDGAAALMKVVRVDVLEK